MPYNHLQFTKKVLKRDKKSNDCWWRGLGFCFDWKLKCPCNLNQVLEIFSSIDWINEYMQENEKREKSVGRSAYTYGRAALLACIRYFTRRLFPASVASSIARALFAPAASGDAGLCAVREGKNTLFSCFACVFSISVQHLLLPFALSFSILPLSSIAMFWSFNMTLFYGFIVTSLTSTTRGPALQVICTAMRILISDRDWNVAMRLFF